MLECEHGVSEELKYASCVARMYAKLFRSMGHEVIEVRRPSASEATVAVLVYKPDIIWVVGHGTDEVQTVENLSEWVSVKKNLDLYVNRVIVAHSCFTAKKLGEEAVKRGAKAYFGFLDVFYYPWCVDTENYNCACEGRNPWGVSEALWYRLVTGVQEVPLKFLEGYLKYNDFGKAMEYMRSYAEEFVEWALRYPARSPVEESVIRTAVWCVDHDVDNAVLLTPEERIMTQLSVGLPVSFLLVVAIILLLVVSIILFGGGSYAYARPESV